MLGSGWYLVDNDNDSVLVQSVFTAGKENIIVYGSFDTKLLDTSIVTVLMLRNLSPVVVKHSSNTYVGKIEDIEKILENYLTMLNSTSDETKSEIIPFQEHTFANGDSIECEKNNTVLGFLGDGWFLAQTKYLSILIRQVSDNVILEYGYFDRKILPSDEVTEDMFYHLESKYVDYLTNFFSERGITSGNGLDIRDILQHTDGYILYLQDKALSEE